MRILFLSQRVPYPPNRGDKITTWRIVERLARRHEVRVVAFAHDEDDERAAKALVAKGIPTTAVPLGSSMQQKLRALPLLATTKPLTLGYYGSRELQAAVDEEAGSADLAYAYSSSMGAFLLPHPELPWIMHMAELDSDKWRQYAARERWPMSWVYARECRTLEHFERRVAAAARTNVFCTPLERRIFDERMPGNASAVLRNGVDLARFTPAPERAEPDHCVFVGVMDYLPNVDGCLWFAREVWPRVRAQRPEARFTIVGSKPTGEVTALGQLPGIEVTGFVDEPRDYLERAALSVAPLRIARGIQNKVLEALAMGLPTVGTTCATQGVEGIAGRHFVVADEAEPFAREVVRLLDDREAASALGQAARAFALANYDWERVLDVLDQMVEAAGER
ncbi:TIGR03087 family PEP-CTERM/XrtA system glycosyltransferase [Engelhardtia mirabilis]|uniref:Glycosyl transferases group 1 n=1 Tax=Engelhardtia mirabilis TaxID=2528011 RepID=A0A518BSA5_9BACT|nr:Glycosyl transferases group 1 [Planctomycetes bacterium Pla133]QDV04176.1 Glycosyl transferases group 1 [Planctomycetes bacterium Pla86]